MSPSVIATNSTCSALLRQRVKEDETDKLSHKTESFASMIQYTYIVHTTRADVLHGYTGSKRVKTFLRRGWWGGGAELSHDNPCA